MKLEELIRLLGDVAIDFGPDVEVRMAVRPEAPQAFAIEHVAVATRGKLHVCWLAGSPRPLRGGVKVEDAWGHT